MLEKFKLLNETILNFLNEKSESKIIKAFTDLGVNILEADFGFVWMKQSESHKWSLLYKTPNLPFEPNKPRITGLNHKVMISRKIEYVKVFKDTPYTSDAGRYMKSFVIIPISFKNKAYGTIVLCFKKEQNFSMEKKILGTFLGNGIAQIITTHQSREKAEKLKETAHSLLLEKNKIDFIANATHELRTPLAIIKGNVDLAMINSEKNKKAEAHAFKAINHEVKHLASILSDLTLIISKEEYLKNTIKFEQLDLKDIISNTVNRLKIIAHKKNISIATDQISAINVYGNKMYIEKMLINLVKNSINYGKEGGTTTIRVSKSKGFVSISVIDDGIGISKEDLPYIFERFYRGDKSHSNSQDGVGLGLAIVKWVAEIHGGAVIAKSTVGKGSVFTVSLPISAQRS